MKISTPKPTKDPYVDDCFTFNFEEEIETRNWRTLEATAQIPALAQSPFRNEMFAAIESAMALYPDFDFVYTWKGYCLQHKFFDKKGAKAAYEEGIQCCKSKVGLLDQLGQWYHDEDQMTEAIKCWIQSCAAQMSTNQRAYAHPFMMLEYVASYLRMKKEEKSFYQQKVRIQDIALNRTGEVLIAANMSAIHPMDQKSVKKALQVLCKYYAIGK